MAKNERQFEQDFEGRDERAQAHSVEAYQKHIERIAEEARGEMKEQAEIMKPPSLPSGGSFVFLLIVLGVVFAVAPWVAPVLPTKSNMIVTGFIGLPLLIIGLGLLIYSRLNVVTPPGWAFVCNPGAKVIKNGNKKVVPIYHRIQWVPLREFKLIDIHLGKDALLTKEGDDLLADAVAQFFMRVDEDDEAIRLAADTYGDKLFNPEKLLSQLAPKFINALRIAARNMSLNELMSKREEFGKTVQDVVAPDLKHNGLGLRTVTVSYLDQASASVMDPENNANHARGLRRLTEITEQAKTARKQIEAEQAVARANVEADAEQKMKQREVEKVTFISEREVEAAKAQQIKAVETARITAETERRSAEVRAENDALSKKVQAERNREAQEADIQSKQAIELAGVQKDERVKVAQTARDKAVKAAEIERDLAIKVKTVEQQQAEEIAKRDQEIAIAAAEERRAKAQAEQLAAEALRVRADQEVLTTRLEAEANRSKNIAVITQQAEAEKTRLQRNVDVDVEAYRTKTIAAATHEAAEKNAQATLIAARANKDAKVLEAEGQERVALIPVEVKAKGVEVERKEVEVLEQRLKAQTENQEAAIQLQVRLREIEREEKVQIAAANALGAAFSNAKMTIWGDQTTVTNIQAMFARGQATGQFVSGLAESTPEDVQMLLKDGVSGLASTISAALKRLTGHDIPAPLVEKQLRDEATAAKVGIGANGAVKQ